MFLFWLWFGQESYCIFYKYCVILAAKSGYLQNFIILFQNDKISFTYLRRMEMRQLKYFVGIAEALHYGNAAKKLFVSQPALSQQIQQLENEIGVELFVRARRRQHHRVELTEAGKVFLVEARRILQLSENALETARRVGQQRKTLRFGIYKMMLRERIVEIIQVVSSNFPDLEIKIIELQAYPNVQEALMDDTIDLGVTILPPKHSELSSSLLITSYLNVILPANHWLAERPFLCLEDLKDEKWIEIEKTLRPFLKDIDIICQKAGFNREPNIVMEVNSFELMKSMVGLGMGVAFIPSVANIDNVPGIISKKLMDDAETRFTGFLLRQGLAWKTTNVSPIMQSVIDVLSAFYAGLPPPV